MDINQNNYESFFLLYVDNELSAAERLCVEAFVLEQPYLAAELQTLKETILPTGDLSIGDKDMLYRSASMEGNMQEAMLLELDNELPEAGRAVLQRKIEEDQTIYAGWELLKKTKLNANDKLSFPHKESLYRREKPGIVIYGRFTRWAVAAALIAAGFFAGVAIIKNQDNQQTSMANVAGKNSTEKGIASAEPGGFTTPVKDNKQVSKTDAKFPGDRAIKEQDPALTEVAAINRAKLNVPLKAEISVKTPAVNRSEINEGLPTNKDKSQQAVLAAGNQKLKIAKPERQEVTTTLASLAERPNQPVEIVDRDLTPVKSTYAHSTLMEEPQNDNHILFLDEETVARTKAGIFFKKLKRTVTRSANINPGNSLKIAGFEFAVK